MKCPSCHHDNIAGLDACEICHYSLTHTEPVGEGESALAAAISSEPLANLHPQPAVTVTPDTPVREVARLLAERNIGCVLITLSDALLGIFSERDMLLRVGANYHEVADEPIRHYMTPAPETLTQADSIAFALNRMDINDFRHIPIEDGEHPIGVISVRDVLDHLTRHFPELNTDVN